MTVERPSGGLSTADLAGTTDRQAAEMERDAEERDQDVAERDQGAAYQDQVAQPDPRDGAPRRPDMPDRAPPPGDRGDGEQAAALFAPNDAQTYHSKWDAIQASFVDEPRQAVEQADGLVAEVMQRLAQVFADERGNLEKQWGQGDNVSTEDLRIALRRYRSFFDRLLSF